MSVDQKIIDHLISQMRMPLHRRLLRKAFRRPSEMRLLERIVKGEVATGISSQALAAWALGINDRIIDSWGSPARPWDSSDFERCMKLYHASPPHLQRRMRPVLDAWARELRERAEHRRDHYCYVEPDYRKP